MNDTHDVITAFLDDEPFDARELTTALSEPEGRELLIDLIALRQLVQPERRDASAPGERSRWLRGRLGALLSAAAVLVALAAGYLAGQRSGAAAVSAAPPATRVVDVATPWQEVTVGRMP